MTEKCNTSGSSHGVSPGHEKGLSAPTLRQLWLGLPIFLLVLKAFLFPLPLLDFWWHLKLGQIILQNRSIPRTDIFSFTAAGKPFIVQNWLAEIVYFLGYRVGGFPVLILLNTVLLVATFLFVYHLCRQASVRLWPGVFSASLVSVCLVCNLRPQVFSFLMFAIFYWVLAGYRPQERDRIWILPLLMVFWVNLHGAFVLGLALMGIFVITEALRSHFTVGRSDARAGRRPSKLAFVFVLCVLSTLLNPEGYRVYGYIGAVMGDPSSQQLVVEWQPPAVNTVQGAVLFYLPFFIATFALILADRRPCLTDLCLYAGFAVLGMSATRNAVWFLLVSAPIMARYLDSIRWPPFPLPSGPWNPPQPNPAAKRRKSQSLIFNALIAGFAIILVCIQSPWVQAALHGKDSLLDPKTPIGAADFMEKHKLEGHTFHPQIYGDYLIWRLWPGQRTFFDGRVHVFGEPLVRLYQQVYSDACWEDLLRGQGVRYVLLSKQEEKPDRKSLIDRARQSRNWRLLFEDDRSVLFEQVSGARATVGIH